MFWITNILLFISGVAAASKFLVARFPQWKESVIKIDTLKGIVGFMVLVLGIGMAIDYIFSSSHSFNGGYLLNILLMLALGIIQGLGIIKQTVGTDSKIAKRIGELRSKIAPYEEIIGLIALASVVITIIRTLF
jgi:hypothetical protein